MRKTREDAITVVPGKRRWSNLETDTGDLEGGIPLLYQAAALSSVAYPVEIYPANEDWDLVDSEYHGWTDRIRVLDRSDNKRSNSPLSAAMGFTRALTQDALVSVHYQRRLAANEIIKSAFNELNTEEALEIIRSVWNQAEETCELAAARSRLLLAKLPKLSLAKAPSWYVEQLEALDEDDKASLNPASKRASDLIVRSIAAKFPNLSATVSVGALGRITLDWKIEMLKLAWMIEPVDLPFPSVKIYQVIVSPHEMVKTEIIRDMHHALHILLDISPKHI